MKTKTKTPATNWGGKRERAGRKPSTDAKKVYAFRLTTEEAELLRTTLATARGEGPKAARKPATKAKRAKKASTAPKWTAYDDADTAYLQVGGSDVGEVYFSRNFATFLATVYRDNGEHETATHWTEDNAKAWVEAEAGVME